MKRNKFNLSRYIINGCRLGRLFPINWAEVLPGDTFQGHTTALVRVMPLVAPVMHPVHLTIHHFFVPWRLVWDQFEDFIVRVADTSLTIPLIAIPAVNSLPFFEYITDYFCVQRQPVAPVIGKSVNALPIRAYNLIFNEYYRDQSLVAEKALDVNFTNSVAWGKDRFTTARTTPQEGAGITVPVTGPITVETLRTAFAAQKFREARSRYGDRYVEYLRYLGVTPSDARLQRPEFLGGGTQTVQFGEVVQSSETGTTPLGTLGGHGVAAVRTNAFRRFFTEHGILLTMCFMRPVNMYGTGMDRLFDKFKPDDFHNRELEHVGQQAIFKNELFIAGSADDFATFGYQDRYDEYRHSQSRVGNSFTSNSNSTGFIGAHYPWTFSRSFSGGAPVLDGNFISCVPRFEPFAAGTWDNEHFVIMAHNNLVARRMVSRNGNPRLSL